MNNIIQNRFADLGTPIHIPPYRMPIMFSHSFDSVTVAAEIKNKSLLAELIPEPLEPYDNILFVTAAKSKSMVETEEIPYMQCKQFDTIEIKVPVTYKGRYFTFLFEVLSNYIGGIIPARELFALPTVPGHINISLKDQSWQVKVAYFDQDKDYCALTSNVIRPAKLTELGPTPKFIMLKNGISTVKGEPRLSAKLVTPKIKKQKLGDIMIGEGTLQICEGAPSYLRDLEIGDVKKVVYLTFDIQWDGLRTVYDYGTEVQEKGLREKLHGIFPGRR
jgi:acetoacetate decarboxylase